jgi:RimJ/RimL family protein N-acetyltransferase
LPRQLRLLAAATAIADSGHGLQGLGFGVDPGQEIIDLAAEMAVDDLGEHVGEVAVWVDAAQFAGFVESRTGKGFATEIGRALLRPFDPPLTTIYQPRREMGRSNRSRTSDSAT